MSDKGNPLMVQGIVVIVVGVVLLAIGAMGAIKNMRPSTSSVSRAQSMSRGPAQMGSQVSSLGRKPTSLGGAMSKVHQVKGLKRQIQRYLSMGWMILLGGGMIAGGIFILKKKNWARLLGFGGIGFGILYFASTMGAKAAWPDQSAALAAVLAALVAGLCAVPMFSLMVEKFD